MTHTAFLDQSARDSATRALAAIDAHERECREFRKGLERWLVDTQALVRTFQEMYAVGMSDMKNNQDKAGDRIEALLRSHFKDDSDNFLTVRAGMDTLRTNVFEDNRATRALVQGRFWWAMLGINSFLLAAVAFLLIHPMRI